MVFVNLSWYDPDAYISDTGQYVISKVSSQQPVASSLEGTVQGAEGEESQDPQETQATQVTQETISPIYELRTTNSELIERIGAYNSLFVANLTVGKLDASEITLGGKSLADLLQPAGQSNLEGLPAEGIFEHLTATIEAVFEKLTAKTAEIGEVISNSLLVIRLEAVEAIVDKLTTRNITTQSITTEQFQVKDSLNGEIYCVRITAGEWEKVKGECTLPSN